jgi:hypothetical protein
MRRRKAGGRRRLTVQRDTDDGRSDGTDADPDAVGGHGRDGLRGLRQGQHACGEEGKAIVGGGESALAWTRGPMPGRPRGGLRRREAPRARRSSSARLCDRPVRDTLVGLFRDPAECLDVSVSRLDRARSSGQGARLRHRGSHGELRLLPAAATTKSMTPKSPSPAATESQKRTVRDMSPPIGSY